jgi:hypothetical protein
LQASREAFRSVGGIKGIAADFKALLEGERKSEEAVFTHGKEFLNAITSGMHSFEVFENKSRNAGLLKLNDYDEMMKTFLYDTHTSYTLATDPTNYVNLDNHKHLRSFGSIIDFSSHHITQCGHERPISEVYIFVYIHVYSHTYTSMRIFMSIYK